MTEDGLWTGICLVKNLIVGVLDSPDRKELTRKLGDVKEALTR